MNNIKNNKFLGMDFSEWCLEILVKNGSNNLQNLELFSNNDSDYPSELSISCKEFVDTEKLPLEVSFSETDPLKRLNDFIRQLKKGSYISGIRLITNDPNKEFKQFLIPIEFRFKDNEKSEVSITPIDFFENGQTSKDIIDIPDFKCLLDDNLTIGLKILPATHLTIIFCYKSIDKMIESGEITVEQYNEWLKEFYPTIS